MNDDISYTYIPREPVSAVGSWTLTPPTAVRVHGQIRSTINDVLFYTSANRHGVSHADALYVIEHAHSITVLRDEPRKLLYVGFDTQGLPREVITDTSIRTGQVVVIHADALTPAYHELL